MYAPKAASAESPMKKTILLAALISAALMAPGQAQQPAMTGSASDLLFAPAGDLFPSLPAAPAPTEPQPEAQAPAPSPKAEAKAQEEPGNAESAEGGQYKKGTAAQLRLAVRMRELKTQLQDDAAIQGELARARCAKTEEGRRILMRNYYTLLYTKIQKLDPSLFELAEREMHFALARYEQHQIHPTVLIEPGISPLPKSCSTDHLPGKCTPPAPTPQPSATPLIAQPTPAL